MTRRDEPDEPNSETSNAVSSQITAATEKSAVQQAFISLACEATIKIASVLLVAAMNIEIPGVGSVATCAAKKARTDAARQAVFQSAELVENIVSFLPSRNIFGVLRVSKAFHGTVESPAIREKTFLQPKLGPKRVWAKKKSGKRMVPAILSPFVDSDFISIRIPHDVDGQGGGVGISQVRLTSNMRLTSIASKDTSGSPKTLSCISLNQSVLDTYISDPPCNKISIAIVFKIGSHTVSTQAYFTFGGNASTWRAAIEKLKAIQAANCWVRTNGPVDGVMTITGWSRCQGNVTVGGYISKLEQSAGCEALIVVKTSGHPWAHEFLECHLHGVRLPDNEDWESTGEAPWEGNWKEVKPL